MMIFCSFDRRRKCQIGGVVCVCVCVCVCARAHVQFILPTPGGLLVCELVP